MPRKATTALAAWDIARNARIGVAVNQTRTYLKIAACCRSDINVE